ncbi:MAG: MoxR family ATPase [Phycisphaerales bacterium]|nr:MoxR family ATPase [Phycisphaerales bacterium]
MVPISPPAASHADGSSDMAAVEKMKAARESLLHEIRKVIVGQTEVIDYLLIAMFSRGHCLLVGVPGLAKTLIISTLAKVLSLKFNRIQFTPDLMPSDITGTDIIQEDTQTGRRVFNFVKGPIFSNMLLADEINRTPPKTQAALLQAMQESQVTASGQTYPLEPPFFVLATQNPVEQEGTYPLPEAQLDRFMFMVKVGYPSREDERSIVKNTTSDIPTDPLPVLTASDILAVQRIVRKVPVSDHVVDYAVSLARATRPNEPGTPDFINNWLTWGAGPRAAQYLVLGAKARAITHGRLNVSTDDIQAMAKPVLRHRIITNFNADAEGVDTDAVIDKLLSTVQEPDANSYR